MIQAQQRNFGCRITEFEIEGMRAVAIENASLRVGVLAGKGADIYEFLYKPRDIDMLWRSPNGIVNPAHGTQSTASSEGAFMDAYEGGWQVLFPTLGQPAGYYGAELGAHGEAAMLPWAHRIDVDGVDGVSVTFETRMRRSPFTLRRTLSLRGTRPTLYIREEIRNEGNEDLQFMWGHHPVLGHPFLEPGCLLAVSGVTVHTVEFQNGQYVPTGTTTRWPEYRSVSGHLDNLAVLPEPDTAHVNELYISDLSDGWWAMTNSRLGAGFALHWDTAVFPYLWLWRTLGPAPGYPWYGRTYTLGLEPFSSVPPQFDLARQAGTLLEIPAGGSLETQLIASAFEGKVRARTVAADGTVVLP